MEKEERIWQLTSLKFSGEANAEELIELQQLLEQNPEFIYQVQQLESVWKTKSTADVPATNESFNRHLQRLSNHLAVPAMQYEEKIDELSGRIRRPYFKRIAWISAIAASILAMIFLSKFLFSDTDKIVPATANTITTKPGSKSKINLPDGTVVWLNADSKISYDESYGVNDREVKLIGEAYFEVVKDKNRPFVIHAKSMNVRVLGTVFNVRAYLDEKTSETSLIQGSVEVTMNNNPDKKIILKPSEKLVVRDLEEKLEKQKETLIDETPLLTLTNLHTIKGDSNAVETAWTKNKLAFEGETLEDIAKTIQRWYNVQVTIEDERLKSEKYSSVFEDETLVEVMNALKLTGNFKYKIDKREVLIYSDK